MKIHKLLSMSLLVLAIPFIAFSAVNITASSNDLASIASEIGKDLVKVDYICPPEGNPHYVEVVPTYMMKAARADIYLKIGMGLDQWANQIIDGSRNSKLKAVDCSIGVDRLEVPTGKVDASMGDVHSQGNPHYWLDPSNGFIIAKNICDALISTDPKNKTTYEQNLQRFTDKLTSKIKEWKLKTESIRGMKLVSYHDSWPYFCRAFGTDVVGFVEPYPGIEPTPSHIAYIINLMKTMQVKVIIKEPYFEARTPNSLAAAAGAKVSTLPPIVTGKNGINSYFDLFDYLIDRIINANSGGEL